MLYKTSGITLEALSPMFIRDSSTIECSGANGALLLVNLAPFAKGDLLSFSDPLRIFLLFLCSFSTSTEVMRAGDGWDFYGAEAS